MSRPDLSKITDITVASIHSLEHGREPRDGELDRLLPALRDAVERETWEKFGGPEILPDPKPVRKPRVSRARKAA